MAPADKVDRHINRHEDFLPKQQCQHQNANHIAEKLGHFGKVNPCRGFLPNHTQTAFVAHRYDKVSAVLQQCIKRDLYQTPGIAEVSDIELMKKRIYLFGGPIATNGILPKGPELGLDRPHGREKLSNAA